MNSFSPKSDPLVEAATKVLTKQSQELDERAFWRLPNKIIGNELYVAHKRLETLTNALRAGNDLDMDQLNAITNTLSKIKKAAKKFSSADKVPTAFTYKDK